MPHEPLLYRNHFCCPNDGATWDDEWSCMCNDRCPECDAEIDPYMSENLVDGEMVIHAQVVYDKAMELKEQVEKQLADRFQALLDKEDN